MKTKTLLTIFFILSSIIGGGGLIVLITGSVLYKMADKKETPFRTNIYSINMISTIQSEKFFIGCGTVDNDYRYTYYVKYGTKQSFKLDDVSAKKTVIIEDEELRPYILKWKKVEIVNKKWKNWLLDMETNKELDNIEIHVPKGTVFQDMKNKL